MKRLLTILAILLTHYSFSQSDSVRVKILKVKPGYAVMKTLDRPRAKFITYCNCPYKKKQIVWIKKPE